MESVPADPRTLAELVVRVSGGDSEALRSLYDAVSPLVLGLSTAILRDEDDSEETLMDVFVQIWQQAGRYDPARGSVLSWVATLARTRAIDRVRQKRRMREHTGASSLHEVQPASRSASPAPRESGFGPAEAFQSAEVQQRMRLAVDQLPAEQRQAIEAAFYLGLSHSEVACELGEPLGTVKTRIRTGLANLRRSLSTLSGEFA